jgi:hypothetical protein
MKTKVLFGIIAISIAIACEKEVNIYVPEQKPVIVYNQDDIRVESIETDQPTENCSNGEINFSVYRNDTLIYNEIRCKDKDSIPVPEGDCPQYWDYFQSTGVGICDTLYNYTCEGNLNFKVPICKPDTIIMPGDTIVLPGDTVRVVIHDTIRIVERDTITLPGDTIIRNHYYARSTFKEDCNNGSSYAANDRGWDILGTNFSMNHINAPNEEGTLVDWDFLMERSILWCPEFEPSALNHVSFKAGSKNSQKIRFFVMHQNGSSEEVMSFTTNPVTDFIWYEHPTYKQYFVYNVNLSNIQYWDIIRWGILVENGNENPIPDCNQFDVNCCWRDYVFNGDDFEWTTLIPLE